MESVTGQANAVRGSRRGWEGVFGYLRHRPFVAGGIAVACLAIVGLCAYLLYVQFWAERHWRQAKQALLDCDWTAAQRHLEACVQVWPNSGETHFQLARCSRRGGDLEAARLHLRRAKDLNWLRDAVDLEYVLLAAQSGRVAEMEKALQTHLKNGHPESPLILVAIVQGYLQLNRMNEAYQYATRWVTHYPEDWQAYYQRGLVLQRFAVTLTPLRRASQDFERAA